MKLHPLLKLFIFSIILSVLSCVTAPKVTDVAEVRYGDDEAEILDKFGRGDSVLYFVIDGVAYNYRAYTTRHTHNKYALLFSNARLVAVSEIIPGFEDCLTLEAKHAWDECLSGLVGQMRSDSIVTGEHDFSEAIDRQKIKEAEVSDSAVLITAVAIPSFVVTWPFAVLCGGILGVEEMTDDRPNCHKIMRDVSDQAYDLLSSRDHEVVKNDMKGIHPAFVISAIDQQVSDRRVIKNTWRCKRNGGYSEEDDVEIAVGLKSGRVVWASLESRWLRFQ